MAKQKSNLAKCNEILEEDKEFTVTVKRTVTESAQVSVKAEDADDAEQRVYEMDSNDFNWEYEGENEDITDVKVEE